MSEIDRIVEYVASLDPKFPNAIRGALPSEVDLLEHLSGRALPIVYRDFLLRMGRSMDWIDVQAAKFDIESVLAFYRDPAWIVPTHSVLIARAAFDAEFDIYLAGGRVVSFAPPDPGEGMDETSLTAIAGSLPEMIGTRAFRTMRMNQQPHGLRLYQNQPSRDLPERVSRILEPLGFSPLWFSTDWVCVCENPQAGIVAMKGANSVLVVDCAGTDSRLIKESSAVLKKQLGLEELNAPNIWRRG